MKFDDLGWLDEAIEVDALNKSMSRYGYKPTHIVLHGTAGGTRAEDTANYFQTSPVDSSSHFVIGQDGHIVQCVPISLAAWGNGALVNPSMPFPANVNPNFYTISIEHDKPSTDNSDSLTELQKLSSFRLIKAICEHYGIAKKKGNVAGGIISHADLDSVNRARCPGPYPWDEMISYINGSGEDEEAVTININTPGVKAYFKEINSGKWVCIANGASKNIPIVGGVLEFYCKVGGVELCGLTDLGLPLTAEIVISQKPYCTIQFFERGIVAWDQYRVLDKPAGVSGNAYKAHIDSIKTNPQLAHLQQQYTQATTDANNAKKQLSDVMAKLAADDKNVAALNTQIEQLQQQLAALQNQQPAQSDDKALAALKSINDLVKPFVS